MVVSTEPGSHRVRLAPYGRCLTFYRRQTNAQAAPLGVFVLFRS